MSTSIRSISLCDLRCEAQVRKAFDEEALAGLARSLTEVGQLQPIRVRAVEDAYIVLDGERRFRAAKLAGLPHLDAIIEEQELTGADIALRQLIANCQREDLNPVELARGIDELMQGSGWNTTQAAFHLGFSIAKTSRLLNLLTLPADLLAKLESGEIGMSVAYELAKVRDPDSRATLFGEVAAGRLTRDGLAAQRRDAKEGKSPAPRVVAQLSGGRSVVVSGDGLTTLEVLMAWLGELLSEARKGRAQNLELTTFTRWLRDRAKE